MSNLMQKDAETAQRKKTGEYGKRDSIAEKTKAAEGLSQEEARRRLEEYGPNELQEKEVHPLLKFLLGRAEILAPVLAALSQSEPMVAVPPAAHRALTDLAVLRGKI